MFMFGILLKNSFIRGRHVKSLFSLCRKSKIHSCCGKSSNSTSLLLNKNTQQKIPIRHFFGIFKRPKKNQLKIIDNIPEEYQLIYRNSLERYILVVQFVTTVCTFLFVLITVFNNDFKNYSSLYPQEENKPRSTENEIYYYIAAFVSFVVILQVLVYKLPMRIYYLSQQKQYIYVFYGNYPLTKRKLTCSIGEVMKLHDTESFLGWKEMKYTIKDQQDVILSENSFRRPADLYIMLGVQRDPEDDIPK